MSLPPMRLLPSGLLSAIGAMNPAIGQPAFQKAVLADEPVSFFQSEEYAKE